MTAPCLIRCSHPFARCFTAVLLVLVLGPVMAVTASAHELRHRLSRAEAVAVQFYLPGHGHPLSEPYEVFAPGSDAPFQTGRVNELGEVVFRPDRDGEWRVRLATGDGHGTVVRINIDEAGEANWQEGRSPGLAGRVIAALGYLLGLFGLMAVWRVRAATRPKGR